jgi:hypothetical protein
MYRIKVNVVLMSCWREGGGGGYSRAVEVFRKIGPFPILPFKDSAPPRTAVSQQRTLSAAFYLLHTGVGNGGMNKFETYRQLRSEHFWISSFINP